MVKIRIPMMVDDARFAPLGRKEAVEGVDLEEAWFGDGPATDRVAVVDLDVMTGALYPPARFIPPPRHRVLGRYDIPDPPDVSSRAFNQVSAFATVMKTVKLYEERDTLGRPVRWAFPGEQLVVLPRAGWGENAVYTRERRRLEFYYFHSRLDPREIVYTSLARDIVAHEAAHAILDGIAPHLWRAVTPQSLALHEAIADLTALLISIRSNKLRSEVLRRNGGSIEHSSQFSAVGEEFGMARGTGALRDLKNDLRMSNAPRADPYRLGEVLSGALYSVLTRMHAARMLSRAAAKNTTFYSASGYALWTAAEHLKRMALRGLDYLPPGEVSFADYGRALLAADAASHPDDPQEREWIMDEFARREIVEARGALLPDGDLAAATRALATVDRAALVADDAVAAAFCASEPGRSALGIPPGAPFTVEPRLVVSKAYYHRSPDGIVWEVTVREGLLKVWWTEWEDNPPLPKLPSRREVIVGTTLSWDWETGRVRVLLTSDRTARPEEEREQRTDRDLFAHLRGPGGDLPAG
jgi:hypothetical protein